MYRIKLFTYLVLALIASQLNAREFDESWTKKTFPNSNYVEYQRTLSVTVTHAGFGNSSNYPIKLENNEFLIYEIDENLGFGVNFRQFGEFSVKKDANGKAAMYTIAIENLRYFDLNGDGYFDSRYDANRQVAEIFLEGKYFPVKSSKGLASMFEKTSIDGLSRFEFNGDKWEKVQ